MSWARLALMIVCVCGEPDVGALLTTNSSHGDCIRQLDLRIHIQYTSDFS